ncbi:MAG: glycosyltransferase family 1 protein [Candidatus Portnoybacteria bacterium]|nr:glycosyltransferase family 1 protein [Candidatus Portnoybacteria bacterium]
MKIGIDCHALEKTKTGVARYLVNLLDYWKKENNIEFVFYSTKNIKNPLNINSTALYYNFSLPKRAKKDKVDILFLPFYMRPFFCGVETAVAVHDISYFVHPEWFNFYHRMIYKILTKRAIKKSKFIFTCSEYTKQEILKYFKNKIDSTKIHIVYLASDEKFNNIKNQNKIRETKQKYGLENKYLLSVASIFNRRHVLESIKAFDLILNTNPNLQFLISGRNLTNPFQGIDAEIERINKKFNNRIIKINHLDEEDLIYLYQGAEIFLYLSEYEGFGLPPLEAMACGTPVLTTKMTSLKEVLGDYPIAVDDPNSVNEIKEKINKILSDEQLRTVMIERGLNRVKFFSWEKTAKETLKILTLNL